MTARWRWLLLAVLAGATAVAHAHTGGGAFILLLPTHLYIIGGAAVVAASFALIALLPTERFVSVQRLTRRLGVLPGPGVPGQWIAIAPSLASLLLVALLIVAGYRGSRDPLANPLPLFVWSVWWIGFTYLHAVFGNLWVHVNPWSGLYRLATALSGAGRWRDRPPLRYPREAGYWTAGLSFFVFAWFELIYPAPVDPALLAGAVASYLLANFVGVLLFGERAWLQYGEAFSVFFRVISWLSPLGMRAAGGVCPGCEIECRASPNCLNCTQCLRDERPKVLDVTLPTLNLLSVGALSPSGVVFILLALAAVSFDGLSRTFVWLGLIGVNPLDYPGRTALIIPNTAGFLGVFALLTLAYAIVLALARGFSGIGDGAARLSGTFVLSVVPIAFGYHFAHYLPVFLVDSQYALRSVSDPFGLGWDLFGTRDRPVITSFLSDPFKVYTIWYAQIIIIVTAHVAAVYIAHVLTLRLMKDARAAVRSQLPMVLLMIGYTMFGLWLLSTPTIG